MSFGCLMCRRPVACFFCGSFRLLAGIRSWADGVNMRTDLYCESCGRVFRHQPSATKARACVSVAEKYQEPDPPPRAA